MQQSTRMFRLNDMAATDAAEVETLRSELENLKEQVASQQEMLESTTRFLMGTQERLEIKKAELERKNNELFDSITYASYVQGALIPDTDRYAHLFKESFVRINQRDTIGGDLPFFYHSEDEVIVAAIDCTGHGVSGAMLTTLTHSLLSQVFTRRTSKTMELGRVLTMPNNYFTGMFNIRGTQLFGLDAAILKLNLDTRKAEFAGAGRPLILLRNGVAEKIAKTGLGIGLKKDSKFGVEQFEYQADDTFYLFSDGVTDQLGHRVPKKFSERRFRELLEETHHLKLKKQSEVIYDFLKSWQGENEQTDDQLLIGIKMK